MSKKLKIAVGAAAGVAAVALIASVAGGIEDSNDVPVAEPQTSEVQSATPQQEKAEKDDGTITDGRYKVGTDVQPGEYRAVVTSTFGDMGYFERCSDANCQVGEGLLGNEVVQGSGYVEILPTDAFVKVQGLSLIPAGAGR